MIVVGEFTLHWVAIEALSHGGCWKTVCNCHVDHSRDHKVLTFNPESVVQYPETSFSQNSQIPFFKNPLVSSF